MSSETKSREPLQAARGMNDVLPWRAEGYALLESIAREIFDHFNFHEIRTPMLEPTSLFERAIGEATDIVEKEMFTLKDRGDRLLCLRPEGTAGVVRAYIENNLGHEFPIAKFFYIGSMFRAERPQKGRYREFVQIGSEYFGEERSEADMATITIAMKIIKDAGVNAHVFINSIGCSECRSIYIEKLKTYLKGKSGLCQHCKSRMVKNPLRILDCKEDNLKLGDAPKTADFLCDACQTHYKSVKEDLSFVGIPFTEQPHLVRGLDYYTRTVFEIYPTGKSGSQDALAAGDRYDNLVQLLGGPSTPAVGFALGVERILNEIEAQGGPTPKAKRRGVFVVPLGEVAFEQSRKLLDELRKAKIHSETGWPDQSIKSQMRLADRLNMEFSLIIGENEIRDNFVMLKNLSKQTQEKVPMGDIIKMLQTHYSDKK